MSNIAKYCDGNFTDTTPDLTVSSGFYIGLGIIGNLIALILLVKQSTFHKWKVFYRLVLTLVCVDFAGIVIFGVIGVIESPYSGLNWIDESPLCQAESVLIAFISLTNILIVTIIAIERFLALWHPYSYSSIKGHPLILLSPLVILISTVALATLSLTIGHFEKIYPCNFCFINIYSSHFMDYVFAFIYVIIGLILATVSIVMNILVAIALSRGQRGYSRQRESRIYISSDRRDYCGMLFQIVAILGILAVCWIPLMIKMLLTMSASDTSDDDIKDNFLFFRLARWALVADPWVYVLLRREIVVNVCFFFKRQERPRMTSSGDIAERKSLVTAPDRDHNRTSYGTI